MSLLEFLVDSIFVEIGGQVFQQTVDIPMSIEIDFLFYSYEAAFVQQLTEE